MLGLLKIIEKHRIGTETIGKVIDILIHKSQIRETTSTEKTKGTSNHAIRVKDTIPEMKGAEEGAEEERRRAEEATKGENIRPGQTRKLTRRRISHISNLKRKGK